MRRMWQRQTAVVAGICALVAGRPAAGQIGGVTLRSLITGTTVDWGVLGPNGTIVPNGFTIPVGSINMTVTTATGGGMQRVDQMAAPGAPCGGVPVFNGSFSPCDRLLGTNPNFAGLGNGPLTFSLSQPVSAFGANIQATGVGLFTAHIRMYRGSTFVGGYKVDGGTSPSADGSALFIGMLTVSPSTNFDRVVLGLDAASSALGDFAINGPAVGTPGASLPPPTTTPEPGSLTLLGTSLAALAGARSVRRRRSTGRRPLALGRFRAPALVTAAVVQVTSPVGF